MSNSKITGFMKTHIKLTQPVLFIEELHFIMNEELYIRSKIWLDFFVICIPDRFFNLYSCPCLSIPIPCQLVYKKWQ